MFTSERRSNRPSMLFGWLQPSAKARATTSVAVFPDWFPLGAGRMVRCFVRAGLPRWG